MELVEMLARNEEAVAGLYRAYAFQFSKYRDFWTHLADEEIEHADLIRHLSAEAGKGSLRINEKRFQKKALQTYLNYLKGELEKAQEPALPLGYALSTTLYIEESLLENRFFEIFEGDSEDLKKVLRHQDTDEKKHLDKVRRMVAEHR